jgi:tetratricopeptide (TPR) repeat protein
VINTAVYKKIVKSQPDWYFLNLHSYKNFNHLLSVSFGFRALAADIAYIELLQYYGNAANSADRYRDIYRYLNDITDIDPNFTFAYTFGSAILAFNLNRYDEAAELIRKGIKYNPQFWKLRLYMGAIIFKQKGDTLKYISLLEEAVKFSDHPAMLDRMLGAIYETTKLPDEAAYYWAKLYKNTKDRQSRVMAFSRIQLIIEKGTLKNPEAIAAEMQ